MHAHINEQFLRAYLHVGLLVDALESGYGQECRWMAIDRHASKIFDHRQARLVGSSQTDR